MQVTATQLAVTAAGVLAAYVCGSIPFGLLVGRLKGIDVRRHGSGNIGATNVGRVVGRNWGIAVFFLDAAKGFVPVLLFGMAARSWLAEATTAAPSVFLLWAAVAAGSIVGHMAPLFLGFKGGKGVATSLGAILGLYPYFTLPGLAAFALWVVLTLGSRYVSIGSVGAAVAFPILFAVLAAVRREVWGGAAHLWPLHLLAIIIAALVVYRHRGNLQRLARGVEPRIGSSDTGH